MRPVWFLPVVPRPNASFLAVHGLTLGTYLSFRDLDAEVAGLPVTAFNLAVAVFFTTVFARNILFNRRLAENRTALAATACCVAVIPFVILWILRADMTFAVQLGVTAWLLQYAAILLAIANWAPGDLARLPSVWAQDTRFNLPAISLVALGYAFRAVALAGLALWSTELAWMLFLTLGWVVLGFLVDWAIVMMIVARLDDGD